MLNNIVNLSPKHTNDSRIRQTNYILRSVHEFPDFFVGPGSDQTLPNIFKGSDQKSVQLDRPFGAVLLEYGEHGPHVVVVLELHLRVLDASIGAGRRTTILNAVHRPYFSVVEVTIDLIQLILQP